MEVGRLIEELKAHALCAQTIADLEAKVSMLLAKASSLAPHQTWILLPAFEF